MPTAGRLAAAIAFAAYGWYIGILLSPYFPEGSPPPYLIHMCIVTGIACGWKIVGARANKGYYAAIGHGLTGAAAFAFWVLFLLGVYMMIRKSLRRLYDGPMEGVVDIFALMLKMGQDMMTGQVILSVAIGAVFAAWVTEYYAQRYP